MSAASEGEEVVGGGREVSEGERDGEEVEEVEVVEGGVVGMGMLDAVA